jgi:hypothetical protein
LFSVGFAMKPDENIFLVLCPLANLKPQTNNNNKKQQQKRKPKQKKKQQKTKTRNTHL